MSNVFLYFNISWNEKDLFRGCGEKDVVLALFLGLFWKSEHFLKRSVKPGASSPYFSWIIGVVYPSISIEDKCTFSDKWACYASLEMCNCILNVPIYHNTGEKYF